MAILQLERNHEQQLVLPLSDRILSNEDAAPDTALACVLYDVSERRARNGDLGHSIFSRFPPSLRATGKCRALPRHALWHSLRGGGCLFERSNTVLEYPHLLPGAAHLLPVGVNLLLGATQ